MVSLSRLLLAPMEGVNDAAFRMLCVQHGAGITYSEMVSAESLLRGSKGALQRIQRLPKNKPHAIQLVGADPQKMAEAAKLAEKSGKAELIDVNAGCPAPKITRQGAGAKLLTDLERLEEIIRAVSSSTRLPVTVKIRSGYSKPCFLEAGKAIERSGASALAIHARLATQGYSGKANWRHVKKLKEKLAIPVIGNGDVQTKSDAGRKMLETGCDAVMIGRAAATNPLVFEGIENEFNEKLALFKEYLSLARKTSTSFSYVKTHAQNFAHGFPGASRLRQKICGARDVQQLLKAWKSTLKE
ncbi:MAG: tRNA dihydrouridine synthase [Candidatus Micrarchaeia archaeon]